MTGLSGRQQLPLRLLALLDRAGRIGLQFERPAYLVDKAMFALLPNSGRGKFVPYLSSFLRHLIAQGLAGPVKRLGRTRFQVRIRDPRVPRGTSIIFYGPKADPGEVWHWYLSVDLNGHVLLRQELGFPIPKAQHHNGADKRNALPVHYLRRMEAPNTFEDQLDHVWVTARLLNEQLSKAALWLAGEVSIAAAAVRQRHGWPPSPPLTVEDVTATVINCELSLDYPQDRLPVSILDVLRAAHKVMPGWSPTNKSGWHGGIAPILRCHVVGLYDWADGRVLREDQRLRGLGWTWDFTSTLAAYTTLITLWQLARKRGAPVVPMLVWAVLFDDTSILDHDLVDLVVHRFRRNRKQARDLVQLAVRGPVPTGEPRRPKSTRACSKPHLDGRTKGAGEQLQNRRVARRVGKYHLGLDRLRALQEARRGIAS